MRLQNVLQTAAKSCKHLLLLAVAVPMIGLAYIAIEGPAEQLHRAQRLAPSQLYQFSRNMVAQLRKECGTDARCYKAWSDDKLPSLARDAGYYPSEVQEIRGQMWPIIARGADQFDSLKPVLDAVNADKR